MVNATSMQDTSSQIASSLSRLARCRLARFRLGCSLEVDDVPFHFIGKGEQSNVQIKLAIQNKSHDIDLVMMEEPETTFP